LLIGLATRPASSRTLLALGFVAAALGIVLRVALRGRGATAVAALVESKAPACRNVVRTAAELCTAPGRTRPHIVDAVTSAAARAVEALDPARLFPAWQSLLLLTVSGGLWALSIGVLTARPAGAAAGSADAAALDQVDVTVTPPAYTGRAAHSLRNPARIEAIAGSVIRLSVRARAAAVTLETLEGTRSLDGGAGTYIGDVRADADGFIALSAANPEGGAGERRLLGLSVTPDAAPVVRITTPGRDLFIPGTNRTVAIAIEAADDFALASLTLRFTRVSGSGERFTFSEGEVPLQITRGGERAWTARAAWRLDSLALGPGDFVVYRAVATDRRPGAPPAESDAFIIEVTSAGALASDGFAIDEERDRYAISQQMVILKTERLLARRDSMTSEAFAGEARTIAAEQRQVRAEFVFMMGGELAEEVGDAGGIHELDETAHAEADDEAIAGRLANRGRLDILRAIRAMSRASTALNAVDPTKALVDERDALAFLQRAFSRTRYILRTLTLRERLDLSRRLTGVLAGAMRDVRPIPEAPGDPFGDALRRVLSAVAALAGDAADAAVAAAVDVTAPPPEPQQRARSLAQDVLRVDAASPALQAVSQLLSDAASAFARRDTGDALALLDRAATGLAVTVRSVLPDAPSVGADIAGGRLRGALADELRRVPGSR
jgi:hypothetical protein